MLTALRKTCASRNIAPHSWEFRAGLAGPLDTHGQVSLWQSRLPPADGRWRDNYARNHRRTHILRRSFAGLEQSLSIIQSNVSNASTPGYARQDLVSVDSATSAEGLTPRSSRDAFAEQAVRGQNSEQGASIS